MLRKDGDVGRRRGHGRTVAEYFAMIRMWSEVLRRWTMWGGCINKRWCWWCVGSWDEIRMVHRSMRNGSRVADQFYMKRMSLAWEDFLFFSLYSFSCRANQVTTLKQLWLLSCLDFLEMNIKPLVLFSDITVLSLISPMLDSASYTRTSPTTTFMILNVPTSLDRV